MGATGDIGLFLDPTTQLWDASVSGNDLDTDEGMETALAHSLFPDRRAEDDDTLPDERADKRGWWGDEFPVVLGDLIGSRLWLLEREKELPVVLQRGEAYAREALQWMLDDGVTDALDVTVTFPNPGIILYAITIHRPSAAKSSTFKFFRNWAAQAAKAA